MLVALDANAVRVMAWEATRGVAHHCPACREPVVLKRGRVVIEHFAHRPGAACANAGETRQHLEMKSALYRAIREKRAGCAWEMEYPVGERRADVWVPAAPDRQVAIECKHSPMPAEEEAARKIADYAAQGTDCLYIVHAEAFPDYNRAAGIGSLHGKEISVPDWVREVAIPDLHRPRSAPAAGPIVPEERLYVHVWAEGRLWALALSTIYRERVWKNSWDYTAFERKREARLLGTIDALAGAWSVAAKRGKASYAVLAELAELRTPHPSMIAALDDAAARLEGGGPAHVARGGRGARRRVPIIRSRWHPRWEPFRRHRSPRLPQSRPRSRRRPWP